MAQGSRNTTETQKTQKMLPYYLHLNCELIECLELIASMILEVPYMVNEGGRPSARTFKRLNSEYERSVIIFLI